MEVSSGQSDVSLKSTGEEVTRTYVTVKPWKVDMITYREDEGATDRTLENVHFKEVDGRSWSSKMGWKDDLEAETEPDSMVSLEANEGFF